MRTRPLPLPYGVIPPSLQQTIVPAVGRVINRRHLVAVYALALCARDSRAAPRDERCGFRKFFERNIEGPGIHKWLHYFPAYEREFGQWCGQHIDEPLRMIEIGIQ